MDHINSESDCGSCLGCGSPIYGSDFLEPRKGFVICLSCVNNGCTLEPSSLRLIDETRARVEAMGLTRGPEFLTAWQLVMADVLAELEKLGIPVYGEQQPEKCIHCGDTFQDHYPLGRQKVCYNKDPQKMAIISSTTFKAAA